MYTCAHCKIWACATGEREKMPKNCPMRNMDMVSRVKAEYDAPENRDFYITASAMESEGYCRWPRVQETIELCRRMGYKKIGLAFCKGLAKEAEIFAKLLEKDGFEVISVVCKTGGFDKCEAGLRDDQKVHPGQFEAMCNPILQARLLNKQHTDFNVAIGLCVGHDSLFYKYSDALVTTLIAKDRVTANNPAGALYCAEGYFKERLGVDISK